MVVERDEDILSPKGLNILLLHYSTLFSVHGRGDPPLAGYNSSHTPRSIPSHFLLLNLLVAAIHI